MGGHLSIIYTHAIDGRDDGMVLGSTTTRMAGHGSRHGQLPAACPSLGIIGRWLGQAVASSNGAALEPEGAKIAHAPAPPPLLHPGTVSFASLRL